MSWHAVDAVDDAIETTRRFLFPCRLVRWTKLALLVLLMGSGARVSTSTPSGSFTGITALGEGDPATAGPFGGLVAVDISPITAGSTPIDSFVPIGGAFFLAVGVGLLLIIVIISVISLSLRLVFYDALHTNEVRLWRPFIGRFRQAAGLFVVSTALSVAVAVPITTAVLTAVLSLGPIGWQPADSAAATFFSLSTGLIVTLGVIATISWLMLVLALRLTYEFVVPTMIVENSGAIAAWQRLWRSLRGNWADVSVYLLIHFVIGIALSIVEGVAATLVGATAVIVAGIVLLVASVTLGGFSALTGSTVGIVVISVVLLAALLILLMLVLPVRILTRSYLIIYEVSTLTGIDQSLTLLHPEIDSGAEELLS